MNHNYNFESTSVWVEEPNDKQAALTESIQADVAIIGGGYTGLSAALNLKEAGVDVVLLERDYCGKGASGRNEGHLTPTIGKDLPTLVKYVGQERAIEFARFADRAVEYTESIFQKYQIDCDYKPVGNVVAGLHPKHRDPLKNMADLAQSLGVNVSFLDEDQTRERGLPNMVKFGVLEHCGGHLHPGKYVMALRAEALKAGVRIYEDTTVSEITHKTNPVEVTTDKGSVTCDKVVVATNAYAPSTLGHLKSKVFPLRVTLFQTRELSEAEQEAVGWKGKEGIYTAHEALESYRPSPDGKRIMGGSKFVRYGYGGKLAGGYQPAVFEQFKNIFKERFPELPNLEIDTFWGGWIGMTLDFLPMNQSNKQENVYYGVGYNGHGVAQATLGGKMVADQVLGQTNEDVDRLRRRIYPLPPEPFRWLGVNALKWYFDHIDRKIDNELRQH
jgi:glycine/D-amino acid oxidase-like deaminating enzyme